MGRPLQTAMWTTKVNELHYIKDVDNKQISNVSVQVSSAERNLVLDWIDHQNLRCLYFLNKSWFWWYKISFKNWNKKSKLFSREWTYVSKQENGKLGHFHPDLVWNPSSPVLPKARNFLLLHCINWLREDRFLKHVLKFSQIQSKVNNSIWSVELN